MKKALCLLLVVMLVGCDLFISSPTKRVEHFLNNYQSLNSEVISQLDYKIDNQELLTEDLKALYKDIMQRQYKDLTYVIKDEKIDGNKAIVTVEVEVYNYSKVMKEADDYLITNQKYFADDKGNTDNDKFINYKLNKMKEVKDKIKYTLEFYLTKTDKEWTLDDIDETSRQKIHGIYMAN